MAARRWGRTFARQALLLLSLAAPAAAGFEIRDSQLFQDDEPFVIKGVVYSSVPIRGVWSDTMTGAGCRYSRDFPLVAALGANTIRTLAMVPADDRPFQQALEGSGLFWLAGFPLDRFYDPGQSLSPASQQGRALREQILNEFGAYTDTWREAPRLIGFVFGEGVGSDYEKKFAGAAADFYSLLHEAAAMMRADPDRGVLVTTAVAEDSQVGDPALVTDDASQPDLAFWSLNRLGVTPLEGIFHELRARTNKPFLISSFGVDAFDQRTQSEDDETQAKAARDHSSAINEAVGEGRFPLLGGIWASLVDEWWRGSENPAQHGTGGQASNRFLDSFLNPAWLGLLRLRPSGMPGLDGLRPREAYFALAAEWGGAALVDSTSGLPLIDKEGIRNFASDLPEVAPGGLVRLRGRNLAPRLESIADTEIPLELLGLSACMEGEPVPLFSVDRQEIRGQVPWSVPPGVARTAVVRQGKVSSPVEAQVARHAPGIFEGGLFRAGRPCPVDSANGVPPGSYLEIYSTGMGAAAEEIVSGLALDEASSTRLLPEVFLGERELPVIFSGLLANLVGVYQTNVHLPADLAAETGQLHLVQGGKQSNSRPLSIIGEQDRPAFTLSDPEPAAFVLQQGGPTSTAFLRIGGVNSFCDPVEFEFSGLPAGVIASIPAGFPGQVVPLFIKADANAALVEDAEAFLAGRSTTAESVFRGFQVTVLPSLGSVRFRVVSGGFLSQAAVASFEMDGRLLYEVQGGGPGRGFNFLTVDPETGTLGPIRSFDTWASEEQVGAMEDYLRSLPEGVVVMAAIADDGWLLITDETRRIIRESLASRSIDFLEYQYSWAIITRKGAQTPIFEGLRPNGLVVLERTLTFPME